MTRRNRPTSDMRGTSRKPAPGAHCARHASRRGTARTRNARLRPMRPQAFCNKNGGGDMSETKSPHGGLTRRSFLKTTGAVAAAAAAVAGTGADSGRPLPRRARRQRTRSAADGRAARSEAQCRGNCGSRCPLKVTVREGRVVKATAMEYPGEDAHPPAPVREGLQPAAARVRCRPSEVPLEARRASEARASGSASSGTRRSRSLPER